MTPKDFKVVLKCYKKCLTQFRKSFKESKDMSPFEQENVKMMAKVYIIGMKDLVIELRQHEETNVTDRMLFHQTLDEITAKIMDI